MEQVGLSASETEICIHLSVVMDSYWKARDAILTGAGVQKTADRSCRQILYLLEKLSSRVNFHLFIAGERVMCQADVLHFKNKIAPMVGTQNEILNSLTAGFEQISEISQMLIIRMKDIQRFHEYSAYTRAKSEYDGKGLPKDGIRRILSSHITRLKNKSRGKDDVSIDDLKVFERRLLNLYKAEHLYKTMQCEALNAVPKS